MALHLHRADRTSLLADGLADLLATGIADPFAQEVVVVPEKGVERWLSQRLSHRLGAQPGLDDGVCAGVSFVSPWALISLLLDTGFDDPWQPDRLAWPVLAVIDASLGEPWCATLARHLGHDHEPDDPRRSRRFAVARRLAGLFSSYAQQRPQLIADWHAGLDTDGAGAPLADDLAWQPELLRRVITEVGGPDPATRLAQTEARLRENPGSCELPARLSLFGHTRLSTADARLLDALGVGREVHLWLPHASDIAWDRLAPSAASGPVRRSDDDSAALIEHRLLASLGRDTRELERTLMPLTGVGEWCAPSQGATEPAPHTLLQWLQADLRADHQPTAAECADRVIEADDRSLQIHACHGASRQVDVLREVLVGLLQDDPTLQPRDIVVMCPDIETFAPLISAGFGLGDVIDSARGAAGAAGAAHGHPAHRLRVQLADRALSATNPLLGVAATLVELAGSRVSATQVLDLASSVAVRHRFAFTDDDLDRIHGWVADTGIRWGLDAEARGRFAMGRFAHNTWRAGLDRLLLGVAMSGDEHQHVHQALPLDDVSSSDIDVAGRLAEFIDRLDATLKGLAAAESASEWIDTLTTGVHGLASVPRDLAWQTTQFDRELARISASAAQTGAGAGPRLRVADMRALLASRLGGRPTRANFRSGTLTVCTMVPMRSVPHRVVCLLGLDDGVVPRTRSVDGDDVLARAPMTGERDIRSEDRQLILDAVMAAGEHLVVCYTGAHEHTGATRPPAVPLGELIDAARATASGPGLEGLVTRHPLQPHDPRNLIDAALVPQGPFTFDSTALASASAGAGDLRPPAPFVREPLPPRPAGDLTLDELIAFATHPIRHFCKNRLDITTPRDADDVEDGIPIDLDGLQRWAIGDRLLTETLGGANPHDVLRAEKLRGSLPPGRLGETVLGQIDTAVRSLFTATATLRASDPTTRDVTIDLPDGRTLSGTVSGLYGHKLVRVSYSRLSAKQRLTSWIELLALSVAYPDESFSAHTVGRAKAGPQRAHAGPLDHRARDWLLDLVALYDEGQCQPLPLPPKTALAWASAQRQTQDDPGADPEKSAAAAWVTDPFNRFGITGEDQDPWHELVFGPKAPLEVLLQAGLSTCSWRLWQPLLDGGERMNPL